MHSFQIVVLNIFFLRRRKNCEKVSPYFSLSGAEKFPNLHFFGKIFSKYHFLGEGKFANFRGKTYQNWHFWGLNISPPYFYLVEYSPMVLKDLSWPFFTFWRHKDLIFTLRFQAISLFYLFSPCLNLFNQLAWFTEFKTQF